MSKAGGMGGRGGGGDAAVTGLVYCHQNTRPIGQIVGALELIWEFYEPAEMANRIEFI